MTPSPSPAFPRADVVCAVVIAVTVVLLWAPAIGVVVLNPDESQFEAAASYLVATDTSVFVLHGAPGIFGMWALMTRLAGPYPVHAMRALLTGIVLAVALILYFLVRRDAHWYGGLAAAVLFAGYSYSFEGLMVGGEWPASLATLAGLGLFLHGEGRERPSRWIYGLAGVLCGFALWFKLQVGFIVFAAPLTMLCRALFDRSAARLARTLPAFAAGGVAAGIGYLAPYWAQGRLVRFLELVATDTTVFVGGNEAAVTRDSGGLLFYVSRFLLGQHGRSILFLAYAACATVLVACALRVGGRGGRATAWLTRPAPLMFAVYLPLSMVSVRLGQRYFAHYFQLMLPPVAALVGFAIAFLVREVRDRRGWRRAALGVAALLIANRALTIFLEPARSGGGIGVVLAAGGVAAILAYWVPRPLARSTIGLALLIGLEIAIVTGPALLQPTPRSMSHSPYRFDDLVQALTRRAEPDDTLFVWGWAPEIYSLTRIPAASQLTTSEYVANDLKGVPNRPRLNPFWAALLMSELRETRPRFVVDASARSWHETEPDIYRLANFPGFELRDMLRGDYRLVGQYDGCALWERVDASGSPRRTP